MWYEAPHGILRSQKGKTTSRLHRKSQRNIIKTFVGQSQLLVCVDSEPVVKDKIVEGVLKMVLKINAYFLEVTYCWHYRSVECKVKDSVWGRLSSLLSHWLVQISTAFQHIGRSPFFTSFYCLPPTSVMSQYREIFNLGHIFQSNDLLATTQQSVECSETTLRGESRFHLSTPLGI
jgi:hypothetical protein